MLIVDAVTEELFLISHDASCGMRLPLHAGVAGSCATSGEVLLVSDAHKHSSFSNSVDNETGFITREILAVPAKIGERVVGVLEVLNHKGGGFGAAHCELVSAIGVQVAEQLLPHLLEAITAHPEDEHDDAEVRLRPPACSRPCSTARRCGACRCGAHACGRALSSRPPRPLARIADGAHVR